jgi:hypothetical protein
MTPKESKFLIDDKASKSCENYPQNQNFDNKISLKEHKSIKFNH